jgi:HEAT repeat protein
VPTVTFGTYNYVMLALRLFTAAACLWIVGCATPTPATDYATHPLRPPGEILQDALAADEPARRANAVEAAGELPGEQATRAVATGLQDEDARVRFTAAMVAGRQTMDDPQIRASLEQLARGPSPNGRLAAAFALHKLGDTTRSQRLAEATVDPSPTIRGNAALALGLTGERSAIDVLNPLLTDLDPDVRLLAAEALWRLGDERGKTLLLGHSLSQYTDDSVLSTLALGVRRDADVTTVLRTRLNDDYPEVRLAAARSLGRLGDAAGLPVALDFARSDVARQRGMAAQALGDIDAEQVAPALQKLLADEDEAVRLAAAAASVRQRASQAVVANATQ